MTNDFRNQPMYFLGALQTVIQARGVGGRTRQKAAKYLADLDRLAELKLDRSSSVAIHVRLVNAQVRGVSEPSDAVLREAKKLSNDSERDLPQSDQVAGLVRSHLAAATRRSGDNVGAIELQRQEVRLRTRIYGEHSSRTSIARQNLAHALREFGEWDHVLEAQTLTETELTFREREFGPDHAVTHVSRVNLVQCLLDRCELFDDPERAELANHALELADRVSKWRSNALGSDHPSTLSAQRARARALLQLGRSRQAFWVLRKIEAVEALGGAQHPGRTELHLARALRVSSDPKDLVLAEDYRRRAFSAITRRGGEASRELARLKRLLP